jgi:small subunit ribosomal protein S7
MSRRRVSQKREVLADARYNDLFVARFITALMYQGKKSVAERVVYSAFDLVESRRKEDPVKVFRKAIENVQPMVEVKSRRVGGATYQVPVEVPADRRVALAMRWMRLYARQRSGQSMVEKLAGEILDASEGRGAAVKKREDTHKMAEANKAFAHYRW